MKRDLLFVVSLAYLLLPAVIFAAGWLVWPVAALVVAAAVGGVADAWRRAVVADARPPIATVLVVVGLAVFWTVVAGIGELNVQLPDYEKHNLLLRDLIVRPWPVVYDVPGSGPTLLCYYVGYYLPTALLGKVTGLQLAALASLPWGFLGVLIAFAWVARLGRPHGATVLALFTLIDGYTWIAGLGKFLGWAAAEPEADGGWHLGGRANAFWAFGESGVRLLCQAEVINLAWTPQHTLAAWIATACVLAVLVEGATPRHLLLVHAATLLWSPFITIGLLPFTAAALARDRRLSSAWPGVIAGGVIALPVALLFASHLPVGDRSWLPAHFTGPADWIRWVAFHSAAVGIFWAVLAVMNRRHGVPGERWRLAAAVAATVVPVASVYRFGHFNDWFLRVPMPAMVVLHLAVAVAVAGAWRRDIPRRHAVALALLVALSMARPVKVYALAPLGWLPFPPVAGIANADTLAPSLAELPRTGTFDYAGQYLGRADGLFARTIMRGGPPALEHRPGSGAR